MAKYIKELYLENENSFEETILKFDVGINLIIGPKGGGKSTLMEILNNFNEYAKFSKKQLVKFKEFSNLDPTKIVYSDESIVTKSQLSAKSEKTLFENFITQDDKLKTNMHELEGVQKAKKLFVEKIYEQNRQYFQSDFENYLQSMMVLLNIFNDSKINYSQLSDLSVEENDTTKLITKMDLDLNAIDYELNKVINYNDEQINLLDKLIISNSNKINHTETIKYLSIEPTFTAQQISEFKNKILSLEKQNLNIKQLNTYLHKYQSSLDFIKSKNANEETKVEKSTRFKQQMLTFIATATKEILNNQKLFTKLYENNEAINIKQSVEAEFGLTYEIDCALNVWNEINEDDTSLPMSKILESVLYKPSKSDRLFFNWIETMISRNGFKKANLTDAHKKLKEAICNLIEKHVVVKYENQNYENLSLGQRTSLMLENRLKTIDETQILFLDQPEDNIDNYTIANVLVKIINQKREQNKLNQIFIVTHNANFGILLNPSTLTIANISKEDDLDVSCWYQQYFTLAQIDENIDRFKNKQSYYLEGGNEILTKRYKKLVGETYDN